MKKFELKNLIVAVAGGLGLIGKEVSLALAQAGAKVLILDIDKSKGEQFEKECKDKKMEVNFLEFDITKINELDLNIRGLFNRFGPIQSWINVAYPRTKDWGGPLEKVKIESWRKNVEMHMDSYCFMTTKVAELMKENKIKGNIVNFGSTYGVVGPDFEIYNGTGMDNEGTYAAIKGGIINFSRFAASYYGPEGIRVNSICPGGVYDHQNELFLKNYGLKTPLRRMANVDEIASAVLFLASDAASYITGATFMVDGGWTCI